jgi:hypothetical protein
MKKRLCSSIPEFRSDVMNQAGYYVGVPNSFLGVNIILSFGVLIIQISTTSKLLRATVRR